MDEPRLILAEPQLLVANVARSCDFFVGKLRFEMAFSYGEPPFYAQVRRGGARLSLRFVRPPIFAPDLRDRERDVLSATIVVEGIESLFRAGESACAALHQPLRREPWGSTIFIVADPDGNLIAFAGE